MELYVHQIWLDSPSIIGLVKNFNIFYIFELLGKKDKPFVCFKANNRSKCKSKLILFSVVSFQIGIRVINIHFPIDLGCSLTSEASEAIQILLQTGHIGHIDRRPLDNHGEFCTHNFLKDSS